MQRIQRILDDSEYCNHLQRISFLEAERRFCRHDMQHFLDTARIAYILFLENHLTGSHSNSQGLRALIYAAGLLHDIGRWVEYEQGEDHAQASAQLAVSILQRAGFTHEEQMIICQAIQEHRGGPRDRSFLGQFLYKADKLARPCLTCLAQKECYKYTAINEAEVRLEY